MEFSEFIGTWTGTETDEGGNTFDITLDLTEGTEPNTLVFHAEAGIPALMADLFANNWGETFQDDIPPAGDIIATVNLESGAVTFECQYIGQTLPGPWDYWFSGEGTWEGFNKTMTISYGLQFDDGCVDNYNPSSVFLTKQ
jgi:hypothetical protein